MLLELQIPRGLYDRMIQHAFAELPNECCGLLAGKVVPDAPITNSGERSRVSAPSACVGAGTRGADATPLAGEARPRSPVRFVEAIYPLVNALASPTEYESEPRSMFAAIKDMQARGLDIVAVYHSHPTSEPVPSRKDRERSYGPEVVNLIISLAGGQVYVRGWWLEGDAVDEAAWKVV